MNSPYFPPEVIEAAREERAIGRLHRLNARIARVQADELIYTAPKVKRGDVPLDAGGAE